MRTRPDQIWARLDQSWAGFGQIRVRLGLTRARFGQLWLDSAKFGLDSTGVRLDSTRAGLGSTQLGLGSVGFEQILPDLPCPTPSDKGSRMPSPLPKVLARPKFQSQKARRLDIGAVGSISARHTDRTKCAPIRARTACKVASFRSPGPELHETRSHRHLGFGDRPKMSGARARARGVGHNSRRRVSCARICARLREVRK